MGDRVRSVAMALCRVDDPETDPDKVVEWTVVEESHDGCTTVKLVEGPNWQRYEPEARKHIAAWGALWRDMDAET